MKTNGHQRRLRFSALPRLISVVTLVAVTIAPLYWLVTLSTQTNGQVVGSPPDFFPVLGRFGPIEEAGGLPLNIWLINSVVVALGTAVLSVVVALFAAFGMSRFSFRGGGAFGFLVFATQMMPAALLIVPLYNIFAGAHLIDTLASLILADSAFAMPVAIWVIKQAMDGVPRELDESVMIDGGGSMAILRRIVLPLTAPGVAAAGIIAFLFGWNDFLFANTFAISSSNWTATKGLASFFGQYSTPIDLIMGTSVLFALPPVMFFLLLQRQLVSGLTAGAVKG
ncbi:MAG: carbohydrate ABC transporter permease [Candidatus Limnocylindrales bacterium]